MFRATRLFTPKNYRTSLMTASLRLSGQPAADRLRVLRQQWADALVLPTCLILLALYEWWSWLFSIPANPFLLTILAAVAVIQLWRRRKVYKMELNRLQPDEMHCSAAQLIEMLRAETHRLYHDVLEQIVTQTRRFVGQRIWHPLNNLCQSKLGADTKSRLSTCWSRLQRITLWPNR